MITYRRRALGQSLVELMIAVSILSVGLIAFISGFRYISESIRLSRGRSVATDLAQDKIEKLAARSYASVKITTSTYNGVSGDTNFTPALFYGDDYETFNVANVNYRRGTYVSYAVMNGNTITGTSQTSADTGIKLISVYVVWQHNMKWKKVLIQHVYNDPNLRQISSTISGQVTDVLGPAMGGAKVYVAENTNWMAKTNVSGNYTLSVVPGTWTVRASSGGYYDTAAGLVLVQANNSVTVNPVLTRVGSGTVTGIAWYNPDLLISQVVVDSHTNNGAGGFNAQDVEYIELYNPTTAQINISNGIGSGQTAYVNVGYDNPTALNSAKSFCTTAGGATTRAAVYTSSYVAPGGYYLFSNTSFFLLLGNWVRADAYWETGVGTARQMQTTDPGCVYATRNCTPEPAGPHFSALGWDGVGVPTTPNANCTEGSPALLPPANLGIAAGGQLVRVSSPLLTSDVYGRAYRSKSSAMDFDWNSLSGSYQITHQVFSTTPTFSSAPGVISSTRTPIAGIVLSSAIVSSDEDISRSTGIGRSTYTYQLTIASGSIPLNLPYAYYQLTGVSTGIANVYISTNAPQGFFFRQISTITVLQSISTGVPNGATSSSWTLVGYPSTILSSVTATTGFIAGVVSDINGISLPNIIVKAYDQKRLTSYPTGLYSIPVPAGIYTVTVNDGNANMDYVGYSTVVNVTANQQTTVNVSLSQGGLLYGYVTVLNAAGTGPLPNQTFSASIGGTEYGYGTSDPSGYFYIRNLGTATYTVSPVLDSKNTSTPVNYVGPAVTPAASVFVGTFTISDAYGTISGKVTYQGQPATYGSLILASTGTAWASPYVPPLVYGSSVSANGAVIYGGSSIGDGTYTLLVRGNANPYNLYFYLPIDNQGHVSISTITTTVTVGVGGSASYNAAF